MLKETYGMTYEEEAEYLREIMVPKLQARVEALERLYRGELMESYHTLTRTRQARYSGPEEYADAIFRSEALEGEKAVRVGPNSTGITDDMIID